MTLAPTLATTLVIEGLCMQHGPVRAQITPPRPYWIECPECGRNLRAIVIGRALRPVPPTVVDPDFGWLPKVVRGLPARKAAKGRRGRSTMRAQ